jgi:hypothetical protein
MKIFTVVDGDRESLIAYMLAQLAAATNADERAEWRAMVRLAKKDAAYCRKMFAVLKRTAQKHGKKIEYPTTPS